MILSSSKASLGSVALCEGRGPGQLWPGFLPGANPGGAGTSDCVGLGVRRANFSVIMPALLTLNNLCFALNQLTIRAWLCSTSCSLSLQCEMPDSDCPELHWLQTQLRTLGR